MSARRLAPAVPLADILEADWQKQVVQLARQLGWQWIYHTFNSRRSAHGMPDLLLVRDRVIFLELKREQTRLTDEQKGWLQALRTAGAEAYVARPHDLEALADTLRHRYGRVPQVTALDVSTAEELA